MYADSIILKRKLQYESSKAKTFKQKLKAAENLSERFINDKLSDKLSPANLLQKDLIFMTNNEKKVAQWQHLVDLYKLDSSIEEVKMLPRLTDYHIIPGKIKKMKVKIAAQVLSQRVSALMRFLSGKC